MGILDLFSPSQGIRAANQAFKAYTQPALTGYQTATGDINNSVKQAIQALMSGQTGGVNALQQNQQTLSADQQQALQAILGGTQQGASALQAGIAPWETISGQSSGFLPLYAGATGAGGDPNAANAAFQQFWNSTGSQSALNRGLEGLSRVGSSTGQLGAANQDAIKYSQDLNQQQYQSWLNDLFQGVGVNTQAAGGIQSGETNLANLFQTGGQNQADIISKFGQLQAGTGEDIANLLAGTGKSIAGVDTAQGADLAKLASDYFSSQGKAGANRIQQIYGAQQGADANSLSALFGIGGLLTGLGGAALGSGGIGSLFGGGDNNALTNAGYTQTDPNNWIGPAFGGYGAIQ